MNTKKGEAKDNDGDKGKQTKTKTVRKIIVLNNFRKKYQHNNKISVNYLL